MKKLMFAAAVVAGMGAFALESANIVGYNTDTITATKFNMVSVPFEGTDGEGFKINECLSGVNLVGAPTFVGADLIQIWDASMGVYENWFYYFNNDEWTGWWDELTGETIFEDKYPNGLPVGKPFWYKAVGSGAFDITFTK